jgi:hypothetical protein
MLVIGEKFNLLLNSDRFSRTYICVCVFVHLHNELCAFNHNISSLKNMKCLDLLIIH